MDAQITRHPYRTISRENVLRCSYAIPATSFLFFRSEELTMV